ncbi:zinc-binding dehydrogenase, partial [Escherichia coli]|uniref:zinc-binding dehydrogenase n=1 Tax=Escherichia coli TaxID=562 RepID=UPI003EE3F36D
APDELPKLTIKPRRCRQSSDRSQVSLPTESYTTREELTEASNELFSLIASGVIKVDVAEQQKYPLKDAQRAHEILESRATQGSSLLIP